MTARGSTALALALFLSLAPGVPLEAQDRPIPVRVTGSDLTVRLTDGSERRGELIEALGGRLLLLEGDVLRELDVGEVGEVRARRHGLTTGKAVAWTAIGALLTGAGMTIACNQVEDTDCGGVFPAIAVSWSLIGLPMSLSMGQSAWEQVPLDDDGLRSHARFPQGAPSGFTNRR